MPMLYAKSMQGFTLVEAVIVITISGIIAGAAVLFMRMPVQGYVNIAERTKLVDTADIVLRRMARDLRLALPNSIRTTTAGDKQYIEFLLTKTGGRYLAQEDGPTDSSKVLNFADSNEKTFTVVSPMPTGPQAIKAGDLIVVYNLGPGMDPANAYADCDDPPDQCNRAQVEEDPTGNTIKLTTNPFAAQVAPQMTSPGRHFHVVTTPVTYVCDPTERTLMRYSGYTIQVNQPTDFSSAPIKARLASDVEGCGFSYDNQAGSLASQRSGLVGVSLKLQAPGGGSGAIELFYQVHVDNTP